MTARPSRRGTVASRLLASYLVLLIAFAVGSFGLLAVYVAVGGVADIRSMLLHMRPEADGPPPTPADPSNAAS